MALIRMLFAAGQGGLGKEDIVRLASTAGVKDIVSFSKCIDGGAAKAAVERDMRVADSFGISSTPTLLINGKIIPGLPLPGQVEAIVTSIRKPVGPLRWALRFIGLSH